MKCLVFILWANLLLLTFAWAAEYSQLYTRLMSEPAGGADMGIVPPEHRAAITEEMRQVVEKKMPGDANQTYIYLLRLGDAQAMAGLMKTFDDFQKPAARHLGGIVKQAKQPLLIPFLIPSLDSKVEYIERVTEPTISLSRTSTTKALEAADLIWLTAKASPEFTPELKSWLNRTFGDSKEFWEPSEIQLLKTWVEKNQAAFAAKDFAKVRPLYHGELAAERTDLFRKLMGSTEEEGDVSKVTPEERALLIPALQEELGDESHHTKALIYLLRLGDEKTIAEVAKVFDDYPNSREWNEMDIDVERAGQPMLVTVFAPSLYSKVRGPHSSDVIWPSKAEVAAIVVLQNIKRSVEFSPELKAWAGEPNQHVWNDAGLKQIQLWWEENKVALQAGEYAKVKTPQGEAATGR